MFATTLSLALRKLLLAVVLYNSRMLTSNRDIQSSEEPRTAGVLHMLSLMSNMPEQRGEMSVFYLDPPNKKKHELHSLTAHRKQAQRAWTSVLRCDLDKSQRKRVLELMAYQIAPCFAKVEMLMDFFNRLIQYWWFNIAHGTVRSILPYTAEES